LTIMSNTAQQQLLDAASSAALPGAGTKWLDALRAGGRSRLSESGLPTLRDEDWRYTSLRGLERKFPAPVLTQPTAAPSAAKAPARIADLQTIRLVFVDGVFSASLSDGHITGNGMLVENLASVLKRDPALVKDMMGDSVGQHGHGFTAVNDALVNDGCVIRFDRNAVLQSPVELVYIATGKGSSFVRNVVSLDTGSSATIVERFVSADETASGLTGVVSEISVGANAGLSHYRIQQEAAGASHIGGSYVSVARDGRYRNASISLGGAIVRNDLVVALRDTGADCQLDGLVVGKGKTHVDNFTRIEHHAPHGTSREHYRSVLDDRTRSIFHGRVFVAEGAQKTDAQQSNQSLLLSDTCEADSKPQLEIYADDVKCAHGATVGQLDEKSVFYLKSRGIGDEDARGMLTLAFASEVLTEFDNEPLRTWIGQQVTELLAPELIADDKLFQEEG